MTDTDPIDVSVIIPAYAPSSRGTLRACLDAVLQQRFNGRYEVVVVSSAETEAEFPEIPPDPYLTHLTFTPRLQAAPARNIGVRSSRGRLLAFTDADAIVATDWLTRLVDASDNGRLIVAGGVMNGTPRSAMGNVLYMLEFIDLHPQRRPRTAWHGATCNLLVPKEVWADLGPFPEDMEGGEDTVLTGRAFTDGIFVFCGEAQVTHMNRKGIVEVLAHLTAMGRFQTRMARRTWVKFGFLLRHSYLAPVAALGRVVSVYARVFGWARELTVRSVLLAPLIVLGLGAWAWGLASEGVRIETAKARGIFRNRSDAREDAPEA